MKLFIFIVLLKYNLNTRQIYQDIFVLVQGRNGLLQYGSILLFMHYQAKVFDSVTKSRTTHNFKNL